MRKVHGDMNLDPNTTAFVECHGTGTLTSDPIEEECFYQPSLRPSRQVSRCVTTLLLGPSMFCFLC